MSLSTFCTEQREKESKQLKSFLVFSLAGSGVLHVVLLILGATLPWMRAHTSDATPIQVVVVAPPQSQGKSVKQEKLGSGSAGGSSKLGGKAGGLGGSSFTRGSGSSGLRGGQSPQQTPTVLPRQFPVSADRGKQSDRGNPSPGISLKPEPEKTTTQQPTPEPKLKEPISPRLHPEQVPSPSLSPETSPLLDRNEQPEPEKPQALAQNSAPTPSSPPKLEANPNQSPVTTPSVPSTQKNQLSTEENPLRGIGEQLSNLGRQSANSEGKKVAEANANSSTNTTGDSKVTGNSGRDYPTGSDRGEGLGNSTASGSGTGTGAGRGNGRGTGNGIGNGNGNGNQPESGSAIATGSADAKPRTQRSDNEPKRSSTGSSSRGLICRECPKPNYPRNARRQDIEGEPKLSFDIDENGHTMNVRIATSSGNEELDQAAVEAVQRWRFDLSSSNRRNVNATISFEMKGSQRQRQNRERQQQREESRRNREAANVVPREAEALPKRQPNQDAAAPRLRQQQEEQPNPKPSQASSEPSSRDKTSVPETAGFGSTYEGIIGH